MRHLFLTALSVAALALPPLVAHAADDPATIQHGEYVARAADCMACHTKPGEASYGGGYVISSPMGDIIASNISSSKQYGIGGWTEAQFARAVRDGVAPEGRLYPAMPYTAYAGMSDADIHALYVYFAHGVKPVDTPPHQRTALSFPFNQRWLMFGWDMIFAGQAKPMDAVATAQGGARRGEYLVKVLAHCSTCHTPRNALMAEDGGKLLAGGDLGGWHAPNITSDPVSGIGGWSEAEIVSYLRNGAAHGKAQAAGAMAEAVEHSLRHLSDTDLKAIADYLKTVPAIRSAGQVRPAYAIASFKPDELAQLDRAIDRSPDAMTNATSTNGRELYVGACASCHQLNGEGTADQFYPSLTSNTATGSTTAQNLVLAILKGVHRATNDGTVVMPAFEGELTDTQVAAVSNYVLSRFGNATLTVSAVDVAEWKSGGSKPWLLKLAPVLVLAGIVIFCAVLLAAAFQRRRSRI